jgi:hypothetical protein
MKPTNTYNKTTHLNGIAWQLTEVALTFGVGRSSQRCWAKFDFILLATHP